MVLASLMDENCTQPPILHTVRWHVAAPRYARADRLLCVRLSRDANLT